jgi:hypothetical protein
VGGGILGGSAAGARPGTSSLGNGSLSNRIAGGGASAGTRTSAGSFASRHAFNSSSAAIAGSQRNLATAGLSSGHIGGGGVGGKPDRRASGGSHPAAVKGGHLAAGANGHLPGSANGSFAQRHLAASGTFGNRGIGGSFAPRTGLAAANQFGGPNQFHRWGYGGHYGFHGHGNRIFIGFGFPWFGFGFGYPGFGFGIGFGYPYGFGYGYPWYGYGYGYGYPWYGYGYGYNPYFSGYYPNYPYAYGYGLGFPYFGYGLSSLAYSAYDYGGYGGTAYSDPGYGNNYASSPAVAIEPPVTTAVTEQPTLPAEPVGDFAAQGDAAFKASKYASAAKAWQHALVEQPQNGGMMMLMAQAFFALGKYDEAAGATQQAMQLLPRERWGVVIEHYDELYARGADYTRQIRALETARKENDSPALRFLLGFHYGYLGFPKHAVRELDKAIELNPRDELAKQLRDLMQEKLNAAGTADGPALGPAS